MGAIMKPLILFILLCLFAQCTGEAKKGYTRVDLLNRYLTQNINLPPVPQEGRHVYVFVPKNGCRGCMIHAMMQIAGNEKIRSNIKEITFIAAGLEFIPDEWVMANEIIVDEDSGFERLDLGIGNVTVFATNNGEIENQFSINKAGEEARLFALFE